jgi:hypothetical protein
MRRQDLLNNAKAIHYSGRKENERRRKGEKRIEKRIGEKNKKKRAVEIPNEEEQRIGSDEIQSRRK